MLARLTWQKLLHLPAFRFGMRYRAAQHAETSAHTELRQALIAETRTAQLPPIPPRVKLLMAERAQRKTERKDNGK
jgi:hypothetical protein